LARKKNGSIEVPPAEPCRRTRRKGEAVRADLITAALALFAERGYARTTTRDIALRAHSSEVLLFRYFQSKANLFHEAVVAPFNAILGEFSAGPEQDGSPPFSSAGLFVEHLFHMLTEHRDILLALVTTRLYEPGDVEQKIDAGPFRDYFKTAVEQLDRQLGSLGIHPAISPQVSSRISFAAVVATALFRDWIFAGTGLDEREILADLTKFILVGVRGGEPWTDG
jgi:AcrR family transcriptional regulator